MKPYERHVASIESIPPELRDLPIWCAWRLVNVPGKKKPDKRPVSPINGRGDQWTSAGFCTQAEQAIHYAEAHPDLHGIGLVLFPEFGIAGGDLDGCRDVSTGEPNSNAAEILEIANTYTEVSPSLGGYRFLFFGSFGGHTGNDRDNGVELYEESRFLTYTGNQVDGSPFAVEERDLTELGKKHFSDRKQSDKPTTELGHFAQVDIHSLNLKPWTIKNISTGGDGNDRSETLWGVMKDMVRAGCDDLSICRVLADSRHCISAKALENRGGNVHSAMRWIASQLPKARDHVLGESQTELFSLETFSIVSDVELLERKMLADVFVMGRIALLGQATVIFAPANAGKTLLTLKMLIDAIKDGRLDGSKVFYINADDSYKGLIEKTKIARQFGFHMIAPGHHGFNPSLFEKYLSSLIEQDTARGTVIVLDTLKKFADLMDKRKSTEFNKTIRRFVLAGGTAIMLAHVNKHRGEDGKVIHAGTSDSVDDFDCAYKADVLPSNEHGKRLVNFENFKSRGDNAQTMSFQYAAKNIVVDYFELLDSVEIVDDEKAKKSRQIEKASRQASTNRTGIEALMQAMLAGYTTQSELVEQASLNCELGKKKLTSILKAHTGEDFLMGHFWKLTVQDKNAHVYEPLPLAAECYGKQ